MREGGGEQARLRRDIVWNLLPVALLAVVGLGMSFAIAGWWGASALGAFNLVTVVYFTFAVVGACGLQYSVLRAVAEAPEDPAHVAAVTVGALAPATVLATAVTAVFFMLRGVLSHVLESPAVATGMAWAAPGLFCFVLNKVLLSVVNGLRRMRAFAIYTSLRYAMIGAGIVIARLVGVDGAQLPGIWSLAEGVLLVVLAGELLVTVSLRRRAGWMTWVSAHLSFGARGVLATLAHEVTSKIDVWILGIAVSDTQVGVYSLVAALNEGVLQLGVVVQNNLNPVLAHELAEGRVDAVRVLVRRTRRWFVPAQLAVCVLGAVLYPVVIPPLLGDPVYAQATAPFAIMLAGIAVASPYIPFLQLLLMAARPGWHTVVLLATLAIATCSILLLVPGFGLSGAAAGMALSFACNALLVAALARWRIGVRL